MNSSQLSGYSGSASISAPLTSHWAMVHCRWRPGILEPWESASSSRRNSATSSGNSDPPLPELFTSYRSTGNRHSRPTPTADTRGIGRSRMELESLRDWSFVGRQQAPNRVPVTGHRIDPSLPILEVLREGEYPRGCRHSTLRRTRGRSRSRREKAGIPFSGFKQSHPGVAIEPVRLTGGKEPSHQTSEKTADRNGWWCRPSSTSSPCRTSRRESGWRNCERRGSGMRRTKHSAQAQFASTTFQGRSSCPQRPVLSYLTTS